MKNIFIAIVFLFFFQQKIYGQQFEIDTLQYNGNESEYINLVILGDGYTSSQQDSFIADASKFTQYFFGQKPFSFYRSHFNVFAIKVISNQSGAKHPKNTTECGTQPAANPDNFFGSTFDAYGIHRLIVAGNLAKVASVLVSNTPFYDQALILVNSPFYGGSGGEFPVATNDFSSFEVAMHELGHSFADLADEYWAGEIYAEEKPNMTKEADSAKIKWKNWLNAGPNIGIYPYEVNPAWYRPHQTCKMRYLGNDFCSVCQEALIEKMHDLTSPVINYSPKTTTIADTTRFLDFRLTEILKPEPNTLKTDWKLDGKTIFQNTDTIQIDRNALTNGNHTLTVNISDTTILSKSNSHATTHVQTISWEINTFATGIAVLGSRQRFSIKIYPNPASHFLNIFIETEDKLKAGLDIFAMDGKVVKHQDIDIINTGSIFSEIDIKGLPTGIYKIVFTIGNAVYTQSIFKQ